MTGTKTDIILKAINEYLMELAKEQIIIAFEQSEKEVSDLHQKTKEGIETARRNSKQIGRSHGASVTTKKSVKAKQEILKYSKDFGGMLSDVDCMRMIGIARNTYYRYKPHFLQSGYRHSSTLIRINLPISSSFNADPFKFLAVMFLCLFLAIDSTEICTIHILIVHKRNYIPVFHTYLTSWV